MQVNVSYDLMRVAIRTILPSVFGALGALLVTAVPAYYNALCSSYGGL